MTKTRVLTADLKKVKHGRPARKPPYAQGRPARKPPFWPPPYCPVAGRVGGGVAFSVFVLLLTPTVVPQSKQVYLETSASSQRPPRKR